MFIQLNLIREEQAGGEKWTSFFDRVWPLYKKWFLSEGYTKRAGYLTSYNEFERCMPELLPVYEQLCEAAGGGDIKARFLSMYNPPAYLSGCSQIAWTKDETALVRNYDYHPRFFDGTVYYSHLLKPVIGMTDCTWGLLDGINADGLAVSLTFGGSKIVGNGFGIPIVVRYLLETCSTVAETIDTLKRIPVHMAYNLTLLDTDKNYITVYLAPNKSPVFVKESIVTNHQEKVEWNEYATFTKTVERKEYLEHCVATTDENLDHLTHLFLKEPLYHTNYEKSFGTLYTASYNVDSKTVDFIWPRKKITLGFTEFDERKVQINLKQAIPKHI
jgi:predicted choloylglycine hydrolase